ncbi:neural/ectodermal development factor IMP-L2 [Drosophila albomicans]|uniref:Neural/ectodermal development factor IMP-L2 n=1 Tax=Drosophila albomicans TaxID=7291 RepID=A0A9C6T8D2_DROAB|nr:neural/ectodermal development factor IMP-L2 [Drosophila albomicans]
MQKMNLNLCAIALLLFGSLSVAHSRPSSSADLDDNNEVDNSIQTEPESSSSSSSSSKHRNRGNPFEDEWLKFTKTPPTTMHQAPGATVAIVCEFMGSQVPKVEWIVGQLPLSEIDNLETNTVSEYAPSAIVRVRSVHIIDHMLSESRIYTCVGRTGSKMLYASTTVHPLDQGRDQRLGGLIRAEKQYQGDQAPRIVHTEKTHLDLMGSVVMLPCKVHARPHAKITWRNNEDKEIVQGEHFKILPTGDLLISSLKWEDMGNYKCIAQNRAGSDSADTFVYPVLKEQD